MSLAEPASEPGSVPSPGLRPLSIFTAPGGARAVMHRRASANPSARRLILVCQGASCLERGGAALLATLQARASAGEPLAIGTASCLHSCPTGPNCLLAGDAGLRTGMSSGEVPRLLGELAARDALTPP